MPGHTEDDVFFYRDSLGEWRWKRVARNNEIVAASSEGYKRIADAMSNLIRVSDSEYIIHTQLQSDEDA